MGWAANVNAAVSANGWASKLRAYSPELLLTCRLNRIRPFLLSNSPIYFPLFLLPAGLMQGDLVAVSVGVELPGSERYAFTRGTVLGSGGRGNGGLRV